MNKKLFHILRPFFLTSHTNYQRFFFIFFYFSTPVCKLRAIFFIFFVVVFGVLEFFLSHAAILVNYFTSNCFEFDIPARLFTLEACEKLNEI